MPGIGLRAFSVRVCDIVPSMNTDLLMEVRAACESAAIRGLKAANACGNFKDDAGGLVGGRPQAQMADGAIYLVGLLRVRLDN
jgi:hypothetical protein